ncbi:unnamed protein product [Trichogramma brassicae]|uniref:XPG N-terminal domain-containing protein n=1 Tax=Trichogramma brassicae TaxID=86971 RepID=A0A6H5IJD1_9HYME|nr:unnamed protein product [Trichogramma brassicae]
MGIQGLWTYMNNADIHLINYHLHNTYLVIDGNSISSQLYSREAKGNECFGGDYDKFAYCVSKFFQELLDCKITPLILIDGGSEDKKMKTIVRRTHDRILSAYKMSPSHKVQTPVFPLLMKEVFKEVAAKKGIKCVQCLFEADEDIASVAKLLNCPILSFDSDFYIFDVMYIPFCTLDRGTCKAPNGGLMKTCKLFKPDNFIQRFPGMDKSVLPLAATLLGNDYIKRTTFKDFFLTLKLAKGSKRKYNVQQRRIEAVFKWLQNQTLDNAVAIILSKLDPKRRPKIVEIIEMIINGYLIASPRMLYSLGFSQDFIQKAINKVSMKPYKFSQDVFNLKIIQVSTDDDGSDLSFDEDDQESTPNDDLDVVPSINENELRKRTPSWFIQEFQASEFPSYFIDIVMRHLYVCPVQIEDFSQVTCIHISLKIIQVIFKLLASGNPDANGWQYITRSGFTKINTFQLMCNDEIFSCNLPKLEQLRNLPLTTRKEIIDNILGVNDELLKEFPPNWRLYIATIKFWSKEANSQFATKHHMHTLLFTMLFHTVDNKIGFIRSKNYLDKKYGSRLMNLKSNQKGQNLSLLKLDINMPVQIAQGLIDFDDCLCAFSFFLSNFSIDNAVLINPKKFHISVVHAFSLFQNCLRHTIHLNALLGYPYESPKVSELLNGTLLYNVYKNFKTRTSVEDYIKSLLQHSTSLLQLYVSITQVMEKMCPEVFHSTVSTVVKKKKKNKRHTHDSNYEEEKQNVEMDFDNDEPYYDANNPYSMLGQS